MKCESGPDETCSGGGDLGQVGDYAELRGGEGRAVFFRPDRYRPAELEPLGVAVEMTVGAHSYRAAIVDVSQGGVAFTWPAELNVDLGMTLSSLAVHFDQHQAYGGGARVCSLRRTVDGTIAGVAFADGGVDIEAMLQLRDVERWSARAAASGLGVGRAPWRVPGHARFKAAVAELRLLLADGRLRLTELENALPWSAAHAEADSPARDALVERVRRELVPDVVAYSGELDAALRTASRAERPALRALSMRHLHETLMQAPWMRRAWEKPLGYPGDFEVMNYAYGNRFSGATLFARALSLSFLSTPAGEAVRARKDLIKSRLRALCDDSRSDEPLRILSIASGPAQEIVELLEESPRWRRPVDIVLFDQDKRALAHARGRLQALVTGRPGAAVKVVYLHDSIRRLLLGADVFGGQGAFDAIYSCGLFDYLQTRTATSLGRSLYALLAPGGTLAIGNMVPANPSRWFMELHLDWHLIYRETAELLEIGRAAAPDAHLELVEEETGVNPFIALTRGSSPFASA